jgi:hypothetical protein
VAETFPGPVVIVAGPEGQVLRRQLAAAIYAAYTVHRKPPPRVLLDFAADLQRTFPEPLSEPARFRVSVPVAVSGQPVISVADAARGAAVSTGYVRRMLRRGDIESVPRDSENAPYLVLRDSFDLWLSDRQRRREHDAEAA